MFVRKKANHSGTISVVVVSKGHGKFTEVKNFGVAKSAEEADILFRKAQSWLRTHDGQQELDFDDRQGKEIEETERFLGSIDNVLINDTQLLLDQIYDSICSTASAKLARKSSVSTFAKSRPAMATRTAM